MFFEFQLSELRRVVIISGLYREYFALIISEREQPITLTKVRGLTRFIIAVLSVYFCEMKIYFYLRWKLLCMNITFSKTFNNVLVSFLNIN